MVCKSNHYQGIKDEKDQTAEIFLEIREFGDVLMCRCHDTDWLLVY